MKKIFYALIITLILFLVSCSHTHEYTMNIVEPTCEEEGYTEYICECNYSYKDNYTKKLYHEYDDGQIIKEPTEEETGLIEYTCINCGNKKEEQLPKLEHVHKYTETIINPTCEKEGYTEYICKCNYSYKDNYTKKLDHEYDDGNIIKEPTEEETGLIEYTCINCSNKKEEILPKLIRYNVYFNLNGGMLDFGYQDTDEISTDFLNDYNKSSNTQATKTNFQNDTSSSIKIALSNKAFLEKWNWFFQHMYMDLLIYNAEMGTQNVKFVSDALDLFPRLIQNDTEVINDGTKGPNLRTLIRSYLHGMMNKSKGAGSFNSTFATYSPDFSLRETQLKLLASQYNQYYQFLSTDILPVPTKENYNFLGWYTEEGNSIEKITSDEY